MYVQTDYTNFTMTDSVLVLKYIGPHLQANLQYASYDPQTLRPFEITTLGHLMSMLRSRTSRNVDIAKQQLREWLHHVLRNERAEECLPVSYSNNSNQIQLRNGTIRTYKVQYWNRNAERSIIEFWKHFAATDAQFAKIPNPTRLPSLGNRYPADCQVSTF